MWWSGAPKTDQERAREIALLEAKRDRLLDSAPRAFVTQRWVALGFLCMVVVLIGDQILFHRERFSFPASLVLAIFAAITLYIMHRAWENRPPIGDRRGMASLLGYEGESPQDLQNKIEQLRGEIDKRE